VGVVEEGGKAAAEEEVLEAEEEEVEVEGEGVEEEEVVLEKEAEESRRLALTAFKIFFL